MAKCKHTYIQSKIKKNECIYESGVIINFTLIKKKINIGNISITSNNTLLDQIIRENLSLKNTYAHHVFTKFLHCAIGNTYLIVDINNYRAIKFYEKVKSRLSSNSNISFVFASARYTFGISNYQR